MVGAVAAGMVAAMVVKDQFGYRVAISTDGETLALGAPYEDSSATGICASATRCIIVGSDGEDSNTVYLY